MRSALETARRTAGPLALFALLCCACQALLPDLERGPGDGSPDADTDTDADADSDADTDTADPAANGEACAANGDCASGHCQNDVCCPAGLVCCTGDAVCDGHFSCDLTSFGCHESCTGGGEDDDSACQDGYHCDDDACGEDVVTGSCDEPSDCASGECFGAPTGSCCEHAGLCCAADEDCPELFVGCAAADTRPCVFTAFALPDTGQTDCFDAGGDPVDCALVGEGNDYYGQDGHAAGARELVDAGDGVVHDAVTGLDWSAASSGTVDLAGAEAHCEGLSAGGLEWRVPRRHELVTLVDFGADGPALVDGDLFDGAGLFPDVSYWTTTPYAGDPTAVVWTVDFQNGTVARADEAVAGEHRVRCVAK